MFKFIKNYIVIDAVFAWNSLIVSPPNSAGQTLNISASGNVGIGMANPLGNFAHCGRKSRKRSSLGIQTTNRTAFLNIAQDDGSGGDTSSLAIRCLNNNGSAAANLQNISLLTN